MMREKPGPNEPNELSYMLRDKKPSNRQYRIVTPNDDWGWFVVSGCAFANFLLPGMLKSFWPNVMDDFIDIPYFEHYLGFENRVVSRWISITFNLTFSIAGSISCLLCELTSHRAVTVWGGLLASIGMMSSSFANSMPYLYISYGIMVGFGAGLCHPAGILIVNEYFTEQRGLANGLSLVGTTVGSLALPPYINYLTSSYGYRGGIVIVSGMMLNVLACAVTYEPVRDNHVVRSVDSSMTKLSTSINTRVAAAVTAIRTTTDEYYAAVVSSSPPSRLMKSTAADDDGGSGPKDVGCIARGRRLFGGRLDAEFLAVSAVTAISHLAYTVFVATDAAPSSPEAALQLAAADAAGRVLVPAISDRLSSGGSASVYLSAATMAVGGVVLLVAAAARADPSQRPLSQWSSSCLLVAFGLASGAAVGLEPLVAVRVLGRKRLPASCSATLLGKGAVQLIVDLVFSLSTGRRHDRVEQRQQDFASVSVALYALGFCLVIAAAVWTATFLYRRHRAAKNGCSRYVRTA